MIATLTIDWDSEYEKQVARRLLKADDMAHVLNELVNGSDEKLPMIVRDTVRRYCNDNNIAFEEIYT